MVDRIIELSDLKQGFIEVYEYLGIFMLQAMRNEDTVIRFYSNNKKLKLTEQS
jgi:hypothetical protein